ncbi:MAG: hypothetical protein ACJAV1_001764 [Paraglaciecola sp.]|jgi:hypothetical protein
MEYENRDIDYSLNITAISVWRTIVGQGVPRC